MAISITDKPINAWHLIAEHESQLENSGQYGATASFIGTMRNFNIKDNIQKMVLEHYPAMTENYLTKLEQQAHQQWPLLGCLIVHRVGHVFPNDAIVVIACWSAHRRAALDACNWLIEELKHKAPFWKKEFTADSAQWVEHNTGGN